MGLGLDMETGIGAGDRDWGCGKRERLRCKRGSSWERVDEGGSSWEGGDHRCSSWEGMDQGLRS